jgi:hypothetical protein
MRRDEKTILDTFPLAASLPVIKSFLVGRNAMKRLRIPRPVYILVIILALNVALSSRSRGAQESLARSKQTLTADERSMIERAVLEDKRVRQIVGEEKPRVLTSDVQIDKAEAEAFLAGKTDKKPTRRVTVVVFNPKTNRAARVLVSLEETRILEVQETKAEEVPFSREDAEDALALAKASPEVRRAVGDRLDQFTILDSGSEARPPFAAQALPLRSTNPRDPCSTDRCLDLIFRTEEGYLSVRAHVDLTKRTATIEKQERGRHQ